MCFYNKQRGALSFSSRFINSPGGVCPLCMLNNLTVDFQIPSSIYLGLIVETIFIEQSKIVEYFKFHNSFCRLHFLKVERFSTFIYNNLLYFNKMSSAQCWFLRFKKTSWSKVTTGIYWVPVVYRKCVLAHTLIGFMINLYFGYCYLHLLVVEKLRYQEVE